MASVRRLRGQTPLFLAVSYCAVKTELTTKVAAAATLRVKAWPLIGRVSQQRPGGTDSHTPLTGCAVIGDIRLATEPVMHQPDSFRREPCGSPIQEIPPDRQPFSRIFRATFRLFISGGKDQGRPLEQGTAQRFEKTPPINRFVMKRNILRRFGNHKTTPAFNQSSF